MEGFNMTVPKDLQALLDERDTITRLITRATAALARLHATDKDAAVKVAQLRRDSEPFDLMGSQILVVPRRPLGRLLRFPGPRNHPETASGAQRSVLGAIRSSALASSLIDLAGLNSLNLSIASTISPPGL
jgi:hypothetical protein